MGDLNNSRILGDESSTDYKDVKQLYKGKWTEYYNYHIIKQDFKEVGYDIYTPSKGYSWGGYIKNDHIIAKNLKIFKYEYKQSNSEINKYISMGDYCPGIPDHAILTANTYIIDSIDSKKKQFNSNR